MTSLEALQLERPVPLLQDTPDSAALLQALLRLQAPLPLQPRLQQVPSLQALCLQTVCDLSLTSPEAVLKLRLETLPAPLLRLLSDVVYAESAAEDLVDLLDIIVTRHTRLAWVRGGCPEDTMRQMARQLRRNTPDLQELHFQNGVDRHETEVFLREFTSVAYGPQTSLRVVAGRPSLQDPGLILAACPALSHLWCRTSKPIFSLAELRSTSLTELNLETNVPVDLRVLDEQLPQLETLRVATWYRCSGSRRPLLLAPVERTGPCCRRLSCLSVTGYNLGCSLQAALPALRQLTLVRCTLQLQHVFRHQGLQRLRLQNIDGQAGHGCLPAVVELDLHCQWGGHRRIDLQAVNSSFPGLQQLTLRSDYYHLSKVETPPQQAWFPHLTRLSLLWITEPFFRPELLLSQPLPLLRQLTIGRQCRLFPDLLAAQCPRLETLDVQSTGVETKLELLPTVRRLVVRLCSGDDIRDMCQIMPALQEVEIHLGYLDHALARGYRAVVDELTQRGVTVTVLEE